MGNKNSKDEIIIAQTASGDATSQLHKGLVLSDYLLIGLTVLVILIIIYTTHKRYQKSLRRAIRREIHKNEISKSRNNVTEEEDQV